MSCLEKHVLPSPAGPSSGTQIRCPRGHHPHAASCADGHARRPTAYGPFALWLYTEQEGTGLLTTFLWGQELHLVNI